VQCIGQSAVQGCMHPERQSNSIMGRVDGQDQEMVRITVCNREANRTTWFIKGCNSIMGRGLYTRLWCAMAQLGQDEWIGHGPFW
jgi:hypothetical protein